MSAVLNRNDGVRKIVLCWGFRVGFPVVARFLVNSGVGILYGFHPVYVDTSSPMTPRKGRWIF